MLYCYLVLCLWLSSFIHWDSRLHITTTKLVVKEATSQKRIAIAHQSYCSHFGNFCACECLLLPEGVDVFGMQLMVLLQVPLATGAFSFCPLQRCAFQTK